ncbi:MAG: ATP-binding cassette domain-containing protein [Bdellovibrionota bacterium]
MIYTRNLHKSFGNQHVLRGLDIEIKANTITCIMGGSGSGKSVFMKCLIGLLQPDAGEIIIDGQSIDNKPMKVLNEVRKNWYAFSRRSLV